VLAKARVRDEACRHLLAQPALGNAQEPSRLDDGEVNRPGFLGGS
jgi:hypothetical protein